eukprot:gene5656-biopygen7222
MPAPRPRHCPVTPGPATPRAFRPRERAFAGGGRPPLVPRPVARVLSRHLLCTDVHREVRFLKSPNVPTRCPCVDFVWGADISAAQVAPELTADGRQPRSGHAGEDGFVETSPASTLTKRPAAPRHGANSARCCYQCSFADMFSGVQERFHRVAGSLVGEAPLPRSALLCVAAQREQHALVVARRPQQRRRVHDPRAAAGVVLRVSVVTLADPRGAVAQWAVLADAAGVMQNVKCICIQLAAHLTTRLEMRSTHNFTNARYPAACRTGRLARASHGGQRGHASGRAPPLPRRHARRQGLCRKGQKSWE